MGTVARRRITQYSAPGAFQAIWDDAETQRSLPEMIRAVLLSRDQGRMWTTTNEVWHELRRWRLKPRTPSPDTILKHLHLMYQDDKVKMNVSSAIPGLYQWRLRDE